MGSGSCHQLLARLPPAGRDAIPAGTDPVPSQLTRKIDRSIGKPGITFFDTDENDALGLAQ